MLGRLVPPDRARESFGNHEHGARLSTVQEVRDRPAPVSIVATSSKYAERTKAATSARLSADRSRSWTANDT